MKVCTVVGARPQKLWGFTENGDIKWTPEVEEIAIRVRESLEKLILEGYDTLICGMANGGDLIGAGQWMILKRKYPDKNLRMIAASPYSTQTNGWGPGAKFRHSLVLKECNETNIICSDPIDKYDASNKLQERNKWMMNRVSHVIAIWDGSRGGTANGINYAKKLNKPPIIEIIHYKKERTA